VEGKCRWVRGYSSLTASVVDVANENFGTFCCEGFGNTGAEARASTYLVSVVWDSTISREICTCHDCDLAIKSTHDDTNTEMVGLDRKCDIKV
jgi:hypothetical protein